MLNLGHPSIDRVQNKLLLLVRGFDWNAYMLIIGLHNIFLPCKVVSLLQFPFQFFCYQKWQHKSGNLVYTVALSALQAKLSTEDNAPNVWLFPPSWNVNVIFFTDAFTFWKCRHSQQQQFIFWHVPRWWPFMLNLDFLYIVRPSDL